MSWKARDTDIDMLRLCQVAREHGLSDGSMRLLGLYHAHDKAQRDGTRKGFCFVSRKVLREELSLTSDAPVPETTFRNWHRELTAAGLVTIDGDDARGGRGKDAPVVLLHYHRILTEPETRPTQVRVSRETRPTEVGVSEETRPPAAGNPSKMDTFPIYKDEDSKEDSKVVGRAAISEADAVQTPPPPARVSLTFSDRPSDPTHDLQPLPLDRAAWTACRDDLARWNKVGPERWEDGGSEDNPRPGFVSIIRTLVDRGCYVQWLDAAMAARARGEIDPKRKPWQTLDLAVTVRAQMVAARAALAPQTTAPIELSAAERAKEQRRQKRLAQQGEQEAEEGNASVRAI